MGDLRLPVTKASAGSYSVFQGSASLSTLAAVSSADQFIMETEEGVQRPVDKGHAMGFRKYILKVQEGGKATAPPLIFSLRAPVRLEDGQLVIPRQQTALAQLDAQHRMAFTGDLDIPLPFVIYHSLTREEEIEIFTTINDKHKGLTKSLVDSHTLTLGKKSAQQDNPHLAIAGELNKDPNSPWYQAVNTGGISQTTPGTKRKVNLRTFQQAVHTLISGPRCQNSEYDTKYQAVKNFWQAVANTFADAWQNHRKNLLTKGVGIAAVASVGRSVIEECLAKNDISVAAMATYLKKLEGLEWGNKTSPLAYVGGRKGAVAVANAFNAVIFGRKKVEDVAEMLVPATEP